MGSFNFQKLSFKQAYLSLEKQDVDEVCDKNNILLYLNIFRTIIQKNINPGLMVGNNLQKKLQRNHQIKISKDMKLKKTYQKIKILKNFTEK